MMTMSLKFGFGEKPEIEVIPEREAALLEGWHPWQYAADASRSNRDVMLTASLL
jgi:hypothetical protein